MKRILCIIILATYLQGNSQDIKMGYLQISWLNGYTFSDTTFLLTDVNSNVNRAYILLDWGVKIDTSWLVQTVTLNTGFLKKYYGTCTYPGPGNYQISCEDNFRMNNIKNIASSSTQGIKLSNMLKIQTFGIPAYTSPVLNNKSQNLIVQGNKVVFEPNFFDPEGDSLSYQIVPCFSANYYTPVGCSIDILGNLSFSKDSIGIYAFSMDVKEWRKKQNGTYIFIQSSQIDFTMDITTDVSVAETNKHSIKVYPNPTNALLNITDENNQIQNATIEIANTIGQTVFSVPFTNQIDISSLPSGMYFLTVQDKKSKKTVKVVKE
ncbi:MAG: T9SS type A sorting domain-containing protein [Bacteroidota bacterium]